MFKKDIPKKDKELPVEKYGNIVGETFNLQDVLGFFKHNINPSYIDAKVEAEVALEQRGQRKVPIAWIGGFSFLLICAAIAFIIISGQMTESDCQNAMRQIAIRNDQAADRVVTAPTTSTTTSSTSGGTGNAGVGIGG